VPTVPTSTRPTTTATAVATDATGVEHGGGDSRVHATGGAPLASVANMQYDQREQHKDRLAADALSDVSKLVRNYLGNVAGGADEDSE
jgi:hypothetical protein